MAGEIQKYVYEKVVVGFFFLDQSGKDLEVGSAPTSDGIPALDAIEARDGGVTIFLGDITARPNVAPLHDIKEGGGVGGSDSVDPWVEETQNTLTLVQTDLVQQCHDGTKSGG